MLEPGDRGFTASEDIAIYITLQLLQKQLSQEDAENSKQQRPE